MPPSGFASVSIRSSAKVISGNIGFIFSPGGRAFKPASKLPIRESLGFSRSLDYKRVWKAKPPLSPREKKSGTTEILSLNCPMTCFFRGEVPSDAP